MSLFSVGRLCVKIAGRDAGRKCIVVEQIDDQFVVVDGATRRKKVNVRHLEPLAEVLELQEKASHDDVKKAFEKQSWAVWENKAKKTVPRQKKMKKVKTGEAAKVPAKEEKKATE